MCLNAPDPGLGNPGNSLQVVCSFSDTTDKGPTMSRASPGRIHQHGVTYEIPVSPFFIIIFCFVLDAILSALLVWDLPKLVLDGWVS